MQNSENRGTDEAFLASLSAAEGGKWRSAAASLKKVRWPISLGEISEQGLMIRLADAVWAGGWAYSREVYPVLALPERLIGGYNPEGLPQMLCDEFFGQERDAAGKHLQNADWYLLYGSLTKMMALPGANAVRAASIKSLFVTLMVTVEALQENVVLLHEKKLPFRQSGSRNDLFSSGADLDLLELPGRLTAFAARSASYPTLGYEFLIEVLATAKWPVLCNLDLEFIAALSCEIDQLYDDSASFHRLGVKGRVWLEKAATSDGRDEQYSADELGEP